MRPIHFHLTPPDDPAQGEALLTIEGELVLSNAGRTLRKMQEAFTSYDSVRVVLRTEAEVDLSFLQLCYAARRTAEQQGNSCVFDLELPQQARLLLSRAGFINMVQDLQISPKKRA